MDYAFLFWSVFKRENGRCFICSSDTGLELHHLIPKSQGGIDDIWNCILVCETCHYKITNSNAKQYDEYNKYLCTGLRNQQHTKLNRIIKEIKKRIKEYKKWTTGTL